MSGPVTVGSVVVGLAVVVRAGVRVEWRRAAVTGTALPLGRRTERHPPPRRVRRQHPAAHDQAEARAILRSIIDQHPRHRKIITAL